MPGRQMVIEEIGICATGVLDLVGTSCILLRCWSGFLVCCWSGKNGRKRERMIEFPVARCDGCVCCYRCCCSAKAPTAGEAKEMIALL